jgi:hypothetical protein
MLRIAAPKVAPTELHASACRTVGEETIYIGSRLYRTIILAH